MQCVNTQIKVFEANCIYAGVCAPQLFVYTPGMYSSSNNDFVRGTVTDFYEMFRQVSDTGGDFAAFAYNSTIDLMVNERVCPMDDMEAALKVRNEALKQSCSAVHIDHLKTVLMAVRIVADAVVYTMYIMMEIMLGMMRLIVPGLDTSVHTHNTTHCCFSLVCAFDTSVHTHCCFSLVCAFYTSVHTHNTHT